MIPTEKNYYSLEAGEQYFSVSQYKDFMKCEAMAMAKLHGEYEQRTTRALLVGSFVDSYFEGTLPQFMQDNPEIFTRKNELKSEFQKANEIISRVKSDKTFARFMSGEKQRIMTFEMFGVPWKMKMDSYLPGICITDLKIVANFKSLPLWRYDLQGEQFIKPASKRSLERGFPLSGDSHKGAGGGPGCIPDTADHLEPGNG